MKKSNLLKVVFVLVNVFVLAGCTKKSGTEEQVQPASLAEQTVSNEPNETQYGSQEEMLKDKWGIKVEYATLSAGDYMIDFRFRVLDVEKAKPILDRQVHPYLIDQATDAKFIVPNPPKVGQLRSDGNIKVGNICFIYFANPSQFIKSGSKVTVVIGDFKVKDIVVQ